MDSPRNSDHFSFFYFQNPMSGSKVSIKRFSLSTVLMGPCSWDHAHGTKRPEKTKKPKIQKTQVLGENFWMKSCYKANFWPRHRILKVKKKENDQNFARNPFLASPDALEVIVVTDSLMVSRLDWCDPGEWWYLKKTWLMWLWWVRMPSRDLTDVTLASEDAF